MRSIPFLAALLVVAALAALVVARERDRPARQVSGGTATLVGDSLNVGIEPYLADALPGWRIVANDRIGRTTPEGISELAAEKPSLSPFVVVSLGTNDPPEDVAAFRADVSRVLRLDGPRTLRRLGHDLARRRLARRVQRRAPRRGEGKPPRQARRLGRDGCRTTPTGSPTTGSTGTRRATASVPAQLPMPSDPARPGRR